MINVHEAQLISFLTSLIGRQLTSNELYDLDVYLSNMGRSINSMTLNSLLGAMSDGTNKIHAIKYYRSLTGMTLVESKNAVERYWNAAAPASPEPIVGDWKSLTSPDTHGYHD